MLEHLRSTEQNKAWLAIYKEMKLRCKIGLILGALGYLVLSMYLLNVKNIFNINLLKL